MTKWQFLLIFLQRVENNPFLGLQMRGKENFNSHEFFSSNMQIRKD